jgi:polyhydroxyalkanoate synthesis regulator phasin
MAEFNIGEGLRKVLLAGVGALATGVEKAPAIIDDLVKKGEITVEQGKSLNEELTRKAAKAAADTQDTILRARLECMSPEERAAYADKVRDFAQEIADQEAAQTVEAEVEEVAEETGAETDEADAE